MDQWSSRETGAVYFLRRGWWGGDLSACEQVLWWWPVVIYLLLLRYSNQLHLYLLLEERMRAGALVVACCYLFIARGAHASRCFGGGLLLFIYCSRRTMTANAVLFGVIYRNIMSQKHRTCSTANSNCRQVELNIGQTFTRKPPVERERCD